MPTNMEEGPGKGRCAHCAAVHPLSEMKELAWYDGRKLWFCSACRESKIEICSSCGKLHLVREMRVFRVWDPVTGTYGKPKRYCNECQGNPELGLHDITECQHCGEMKLSGADSSSYVMTVHRAKICHDCKSAHYVQCDSCSRYETRANISEMTRENAGLYEEGSDDDPEEVMQLCSVCERGGDVQSIIHQYNYRPTPNFKCIKKELGSSKVQRIDDGSRLFMGVELEIDEGNNGSSLVRKLQKSWDELLYCKHDGSLSERGFEIVTHPMTLDFHKTEFPWDKILGMCKAAKYKSYDAQSSCGFHVHVNRTFFGPLRKSCFLKLASFVHMHSTYIPRIAQRNSNGYSKFKVIRKVSHLYTLTGLRPAGDYGDLNPERYDAVNFVNKATLEFRIFKGTLDHNTIMSYLEFVHAVMNFVKDAPSTLILKNMASWKKFCQYVGSNSKTYEYLPQYMKSKDCWRD